MAADRPAARLTWLERALLRLLDRRSIDGLEIAAADAGETALERVEAALALIRTFDPRRYDRIRRDLERIWVHVLPGPLAQFNARLNACELDTRFVLNPDSTPEIIAAVIVHEATHARLERCGVRYDEDMRARVEGICVRRELAFVARLPDGRPARAWIEANAQLSPEAFTDAAFAEREREGQLEALRFFGVPEWLLRMLLALTTARRTVLGLFAGRRERHASPR